MSLQVIQVGPDGIASVTPRVSSDAGSGGLNVGAGGATGAAIGSIVPGIGTAIGATVGSLVGLLSSIGIQIKGPTRHEDWDKANADARALASKIATQVRAAYDLTTYNKIGEKYRLNMIQLIPIRWGDDYPEPNSAIISYLQKFPTQPDGGNSVYTVTWIWAMWALRNHDLDNPAEFGQVAQNDLNAALIGAIKNVTGDALPSIDLGIKGSGLSTQVTGTTGAGIDTVFAGIGSNAFLVILMIGVAVFFFLRKK